MDEAKKRAVDRTGQQWGQYRIISSLEQGRFSKAYLGEHISDRSKQFVIDILPMPLTKENVDIFLQQGRRLTQLIHPHILRLVDVGVENFVPFLIMEYVSHIPLRQLYKSEGQPLDKLLPHLRQIVTALQFAHDRDILHKGIRPDNVLLGSSNGILLCDFTIDVVSQDERYQNYLRSKNTVDVMAYVAPEQIQHHTNKASDQYSLAVMIYEWLCGVPPFQGKYFEMANHHLHTPPLPLKQRVPTVSSAVEEVVLTALAKDPSRRFASVSAFLNALTQAHNPKPAVPPSPRPVVPSSPVPTTPPVRDNVAVASSPVPPLGPPMPEQPPVVPPGPNILPPPPVTPVPPVMLIPNPGPPLAAGAFESSQRVAPPPDNSPLQRRQQKRGLSTRRAFVIAVAGLATLGGVGGWLTWRRLYPLPPPPPPPPSPSPLGTPSVQQPILIYRGHEARVNAVAWSPNGKLIASAGEDKLVLICDSTNGNTLFTYKGHSDAVRGIAWSPDSQHIASASADQTVQVWEALTGKLVHTYTGHSAAVNSVSWSSNGRLIASGSDDTTLQAWFAKDGAVFLNYQEHTNAVISVVWSPDDRRIASGSWDGTVQVCSTVRTPAFAVGDKVFSYNGHRGDKDAQGKFHPAEVYAIAWSPDSSRLASAGADGLVQVCNGINGSAVKTSSGINYPPRRQDGPIRSVTWLPDGRSIISASDDKTVRVWDGATGDNTATFRQSTGTVFAVDCSPDSKFIVLGGSDKTVQVFGLS